MDAKAIKRGFLLACAVTCLVWLGGFTESSVADNFKVLNAPQTSTGVGLFATHFAIGDFDGDQKPDLATVQADPYAQQTSRYSIHLQLSLGARSAIGLIAPFGGLLLSAEDVNGDRAVDLVVTAALDHHVVAVLVNDGQGNFSFAEAGAFPELIVEGGYRIDVPSEPSSTRVILWESRWTFGENGEHAKRSDSPTPSVRFSSQEQLGATIWNAGGSSGRAPPSCCYLS